MSATSRGMPALVLLWGLSACEPATPVRNCSGCTYDFADTNPPAKALVFKWPVSRQPVRFYADPRGAMPDLVALGIAAWEGQFLYGEFRGTAVADSSQADVIVLWGNTILPNVPPDAGPPIDACAGTTTNPAAVFIDSSANVLHVTLDAKAGFAEGVVAACLQRMVIHELGHALGLLKHSPSSFDIMNATPTVTAPSTDDRNTVEILYHSHATVAPPPR